MFVYTQGLVGSIVVLVRITLATVTNKPKTVSGLIKRNLILVCLRVQCRYFWLVSGFPPRDDSGTQILLYCGSAKLGSQSLLQTAAEGERNSGEGTRTL